MTSLFKTKIQQFNLKMNFLLSASKNDFSSQMFVEMTLDRGISSSRTARRRIPNEFCHFDE